MSEPRSFGRKASVYAVSAFLALASAGLLVAVPFVVSERAVIQHAGCVAGGSTSDDDSITTGGAIGNCLYDTVVQADGVTQQTTYTGAMGGSSTD